MEITHSNQRLYFRQLLSGRDFAVKDEFAQDMVNFVYLIGDLQTRQCVIVDPAYAVDDLLRIIQTDEMNLTGVLATHYHADHIGGSMMGINIEGISHILETNPVPIHINHHESEWVIRTTKVSQTDLVLHHGGDHIEIGSVRITFVHTPGHTPGSQCFLVEDRLVAGDTLFLEACGRTDLPGSNPSDMYSSLQQLAKLPSHTLVCPGHQYSAAPTAPLGQVVATNRVFKPQTQQQWLDMFERK